MYFNVVSLDNPYNNKYLLSATAVPNPVDRSYIFPHEFASRLLSC